MQHFLSPQHWVKLGQNHTPAESLPTMLLLKTKPFPSRKEAEVLGACGPGSHLSRKQRDTVYLNHSMLNRMDHFRWGCVGMWWPCFCRIPFCSPRSLLLTVCFLPTIIVLLWDFEILNQFHIKLKTLPRSSLALEIFHQTISGQKGFICMLPLGYFIHLYKTQMCLFISFLPHPSRSLGFLIIIGEVVLELKWDILNQLFDACRIC